MAENRFQYQTLISKWTSDFKVSPHFTVRYLNQSENSISSANFDLKIYELSIK